MSGTAPTTIRIDETGAQRRDRLKRERIDTLKRELAALGELPEEAATAPPATTDDAPDVAFDKVLETEIRRLLRLGDDKFFPSGRDKIVNAGVRLWCAQNNKGPQFGEDLD